MQRRKVRRLSVAAVCAVSLLGYAAPSIAEQRGPAKASDAAVEQVRQDLAESSAAMLQAATDLQQAQISLKEARKKAASARQRLAEVRRRQEAAAHRRLVAQSQLHQATRNAEASARRVNEQRSRLGRAARAAYQQGGVFNNVSVLLEANSPADFTERLVALDQVVAAQRSMLSELEAAERTTKSETYSFMKLRDELVASHKQAEADAELIGALVQETAAAEREVQRLVEAQREALSAAMAAQAEDERRLLELRGESDRLTQQLALRAQALLGASGVRAGHSYPASANVLRLPVAGPVTSPYGMRVHPVTGVHKLHTGTDFGAPCGTPIVAARAGEVISAGFNRAYGWRTVISHGLVGGALLTTTYNHQTEIAAAVGDRVKAGQVIGTVGTTGYSTGCHLHFELIINSDVVDPLPWLLLAK